MLSYTKDDANSKDSTIENFAQAKNDIQAKANKVGHNVRNFIDSASEEISHAKSVVGTQIREKPVQSSLIALGIGYLLGALFRR